MKTYKTTIPEIKLKKIKTNFNKAKVSSSSSASEYARQFYHDDLTIYESFFMILLNNANNTIGYVKISQGGITGTLADTRIIAKYAINSLATAVILVHNHPSGTLKPSRADRNITDKIKKTLNIFDCKVLDHIILTETDYYSFADNNIF
ncbi:JAB domain-containing protein [Flavivirga aquimarina]|uniref:JAB domain-containing protein n=1 Tax=Flavivirga aquimarina TaxID=2027862 RepID=A0ABT8WCQ3_9FLAO|nr:JAB domain-containing protein [Flavivirga aquimarina]MDO5970895.1 JAB domain-containing protein [Flavivirga aquimarina]